MTSKSTNARKSPLAARERTRADHVQRVLRVVVHVQTRLDADLSLPRLAKLAHLSPHHFQRVFAATLGESCKRHVHRLRLERAARALRDTGRDMEAIAIDAGYSDVPAFYRAFRAHFGAAPANWRERAARRRHPAARPASVCRWQVGTGPDGQLRSIPWPAARAPKDAGPAARIVQLAKLRIAFVRRTGSVPPRAAAGDFARLLTFAARRNPVHEPLLVRLHHDDPSITPARHRRTDHGITIGPRRRGEADIGIQTIGDGEMLVATCARSSDVLAVRQWLESEALAASGAVRRSGPVVEVLLDDADPAGIDAMHDVLVPVAPLSTAHPWYWRRRRAPEDSPSLPSLDGRQR